MTNSKRIKVGFIGAGNMGQAAHLRNYIGLSAECEVVALAELRGDLRKEVAARYGIARTYESGAQLLEAEQLDAVVAAQPFWRHGVLLPELAKAKLPLFSEKPLAASVQTGEKIVKSLEENGTWLMLGYHKRSDLATEYAKKEIAALKQSEELGKLRYIRITMPPGDWVAGGFNDLVEGSGNREALKNLESDPVPPDMEASVYAEYGAFVNYYIHQVNLLRFLLGESYKVSYADPAKVLLVAHSLSGIPCTIEMQPYSTTLDWQETALVAFDKGYVKVTLPSPLAYNRPGQVEIFKDSNNGEAPRLIQPQLPWVHAMRNQALNFIKAVRGEAPAPCLAPEALEDLKIAREYIRLLKGV